MTLAEPLATYARAQAESTRELHRRDLRGPAFVLGSLLLANALLLTPIPIEWRLIGAMLLFILLPGYLLVQAVFVGGLNLLERRLLAIGCGYALAMFLSLTLYVLFRPMSTAHLVVAANLLTLGLLAGALARRAELWPQVSRPGWILLGILAVAAPLRLFNLGYSDFQGDEAKVVLRSMALLQGVPDVLLAHRKPPGEVLLNASLSGALGSITEQTVRVPFALAGVVGVVAFYQLGRAMFGAWPALVAALLIAVSGYFIAFGRILQYPSIALLVDCMAVLCLYRFARGAREQRGYAVAGALLLPAAGLAALSGVFLLPVAALALWSRMRGPGRAAWRDLAIWFWPLAFLLPVLVVILLRLRGSSADVLNPGGTFATYLGYRLGGNRPYFNFDRFLLSFNHYNSGLYTLVVLLGALIVVLKEVYTSALQGFRQQGHQSLMIGLGVLLLVDMRNLAAAVVVVSIVLFLLSTPRLSVAWKLGLVWMAGPLFAHLFLVRLVGTHWREMLPGLLLLLGYAAVGLYSRLRHGALRSAAIVLGCLFMVANLHFVWVTWIQPWPEYQLTYPQNRHPLDWSGSSIPRGGSILGATRRHGWKAVGELMARGELPSTYATNSRAEAVWYLKDVRKCLEVASVYVRPPTTPSMRTAIIQGLPAPYGVLAGRMYVNGQPSLALITRQRLPGSPVRYNMDDYVADFDRHRSSVWSPIGRLYHPVINANPECPGGRLLPGEE